MSENLSKIIDLIQTEIGSEDFGFLKKRFAKMTNEELIGELIKTDKWYNGLFYRTRDSEQNLRENNANEDTTLEVRCQLSDIREKICKYSSALLVEVSKRMGLEFDEYNELVTKIYRNDLI